MGKEEQRIIVVSRKNLFGDDWFQGFREYDKIDYESRILSNLEIMRRGSTTEPANHPKGNAELDTSYKQPIGYTIVANPELKKVFAYQRSSEDKEYGEKRLQGKWSWGFGGHIEPFDSENGNPIRESMIREVTQEELGIDSLGNMRILGYLNDDEDSIGSVHFGVLYLLETLSEMVVGKDSEIAKIEAKSIGELEEICSSLDYEVEGWSKIALEPLRKLL